MQLTEKCTEHRADSEQSAGLRKSGARGVAAEYAAMVLLDCTTISLDERIVMTRLSKERMAGYRTGHLAAYGVVASRLAATVKGWSAPAVFAKCSALSAYDCLASAR